MADFLDKVSFDTGIARTTGGGVGILGGVMALTGAALAPFTAGASLVLTVAGVGTSVAGGVTSFTSAMIKLGWDNSQSDKIKTALDEFAAGTEKAAKLIDEFHDAREKALKFLETEPGKKFLRSWFDEWGKGTGQGVSKGATLALSTARIVTGVNSVRLVGKIEMSAHHAYNLVRIVDPRLVKEFGTSVSRAVVFSEVAIPKFVPYIGGKVIVQAGSAGAKALTVIGGAVSVGFGIWDVIGGAQDISQKSEISQKIRSKVKEAKENIDPVYAHLIKLCDEVSKIE